MILHAASKLASGLSTVNDCSYASIGTLTRTYPLIETSLETASLATIRGGASTSAIVNFSRESLSLQGIGSYVTITALILNASLRMWTSTKFSKEQDKIVTNIFYAATALCLMSGVFTAILFQLLTIYGKTALGMGNDGGYIAFKSASRMFRIWGFRSFLVEMTAFIVSFMSHLYNTLWDNARQHDSKSALTTTGKLIMSGSIILMLSGLSCVRAVLNLASQLVFH